MIESNRIDYLDAMRSILMMLGIVLHSANVFTGQGWAVQNVQTSPYLHDLVEFIHAFRMPAFFIVSGFFCHLTLSRYASRKFLKKRLPRILLPLLVTAFTLNLAQSVFLSDLNDSSYLVFQASYWLSGSWASHLWFLICLTYYFLFTAIFYQLAPNVISKIGDLINTIPKGLNLLTPVLFIFFTLITTKIGYFIGNIEKQTINLYLGESALYAPYFLFGILLGYKRSILESLINTPITLLLAIFGGILLAQYVSTSIFALPLSTVMSWVLSILCFVFFSKVIKGPSGFFTYYSDASYTLYLFHHLLVIVFASFIVDLHISLWAKFITLMIIVFVSTSLIHEFIIKRIDILSYLFNGKRKEERIKSSPVQSNHPINGKTT